MNVVVLEQVRAVYAAVDASIAAASPRCDASGKCCRFKEYDHTLFLSHFEAEILLHSAPAYAELDDARCPFQVEGKCTARAERPLGCRIYFCDSSFQDRMSDITELALNQLKTIAEKHGTGWSYAPLHFFLKQNPNRGVYLVSQNRIPLL